MLALRLDKTHTLVLEDAESKEKLAQIVIAERSRLHYIDLVVDSPKGKVRIYQKELGRKIERIGDESCSNESTQSKTEN